MTRMSETGSRVREGLGRIHVAHGSLAAILIASTALISGAQAQPQQAQQSVVEELVVTARRTEERLQDVPLQVAAFTSDYLRAANAVGVRDLNNMSPGLNYQGNSGGRVGPGRVFFRGLAAGQNNSSKASIFLDGNFLATNGQDIPFNYFSQVEVMPGPQSAQFGRATFGGALNYITKDPTNDGVHGKAAGSLATLGDHQFDVFVGGPLIKDKLLGSVFVGYFDYNGPKSWRSVPDVLHSEGVPTNSLRSQFNAAKLIFTPSDDLKVKLHAMYTKDKDAQTPLVWFVDPVAGRTVPFTKPNGTTVYYPGGVIDVDSYPGGFPFMGVNFDQIADPFRYQQSWRTAATVDWHVADHDVTLSGYREFETNKLNGTDGDFTSFPGSHNFSKITVKAKSAELRVNSPQNQRFRYAAGVYYLDLVTLTKARNVTDFRCDTICMPTSAAALFNPSANYNAATRTIAGFTGLITRINATTPTDRYEQIRNQSVFGAVFFDVTEKLTASFEARYQAERITQRNFVVNGFSGQNTFNAFLPRANVSYKFTPDVMAYAVYSIGNNSGGFNTSQFIGLPGTGTTEANRFIPEEKLYNYEAGFKAKWLDGKLVTNFAAFHMVWKNAPQTETHPSPTPGVNFNITTGQGDAKFDGFGLEVQAVPADGWDVRGTIAYTRPIYTNWCSVNLFALTGRASPGQGACTYANGNYIETTPPWSGSVIVGYRNHIHGDWDWFVRGGFQYQDGMWESDMNLARSKVAYVFNLNLGIRTEAVSIEVFCSNCSQEESPYRFVRLNDPRGGPDNTTNASVTTAVRKPRQFGVKAAWDF